jgi:hypothetical protein
VADPDALAGRLVAVGTGERGSAAADRWRLEPGPLAVCLVVDGVPVEDLPPGTRLRVGGDAILELGAAIVRDDATGEAGSVLERGAASGRAAAVLERGAVEPGDAVTLLAVALPVTDVLDLHSFRPRDVPEVVAEYVLAARRAGLTEVRIVHGRGRGVQRAVVRRLLTGAAGVAGFTEAPPARGGWGATIVRLLPAEEPLSG